ncbi:MAG TPA: HNH endonuclease signature motif containing protein, partial [Yaniella sp.]
LPGPGVTAEVMVLMEDTTLFGDDDQPAWIPGHGPVPAGIIKDWLADPQMKAFLRRMYTRPADGQLVAMESRRRAFPTGLAKMLKLRDDTCATPFCNNPVEEADHRTPWAKGGTTSWDNATGLCRRCNQRKENRGWRYSGTPDELTVTTPTGHQYTVPTLPPLTQLRPNSSDPPTSSDPPSTSDPPPPGVVIDIAHPTTKITWRLAA